MSEAQSRSPAVDEEGDELDPCLDQLRRERADFLNYKHRVERERADDRDRAQEKLLRQLVPVLDDLDRALDHTPRELAQHPWATGIALAREHFLEALRQVGVERIGNEGERFDPSVHEAVMYREQPGATDQLVESVMRPGYRFGQHLLRPAQVVVLGPPTNASAHEVRRHAENGQGNWY